VAHPAGYPQREQNVHDHGHSRNGSIGDFNGPIGNMEINAFDAQLHAIIPFLHLHADETPLFVTQSVTADALGYHDAFLVPDGHGGQRVQPLIWSSWLDPAQVGDPLGDVSTLNNESRSRGGVSRNRSPWFLHSSKRASCSGVHPG
jgi:hypothetical protein